MRIAVSTQTGWNLFVVWFGMWLGAITGLFWGDRTRAHWLMLGIIVLGLLLKYGTKDKVPLEVQSEGDAKDTSRDTDLQA